MVSFPNLYLIEIIGIVKIIKAIAPRLASYKFRKYLQYVNSISFSTARNNVGFDPESRQTLISGMGELHLEIYVERMKREYNAQVDVGNPAVQYRETISASATFDYKLKKQTGGSGMFAHLTARLEPCNEPFVFENKVVGGQFLKNISPLANRVLKKL